MPDRSVVALIQAPRPGDILHGKVVAVLDRVAIADVGAAMEADVIPLGPPLAIGDEIDVDVLHLHEDGSLFTAQVTPEARAKREDWLDRVLGTEIRDLARNDDGPLGDVARRMLEIALVIDRQEVPPELVVAFALLSEAVYRMV